MLHRLWRIGLGVAIGIGALIVLALLAAAFYVGPRILEKGGAPRSLDRPELRTADAVAIEQTELHTCGFLVMSAAYNVYGLSPEDKNLRFRLGVDTKAHPFDETSTGTLHPDLYRVLAQDGFAIEEIDPDATDAGPRLIRHLEDNGLALILIKRRQTDGLHWVLADKPLPTPSTGEMNRVRIIDSLASFPYQEALDDFLPNHVLSIIAIAPETGDEGTKGVHVDGLAEMKRVYARMKAR